MSDTQLWDLGGRSARDQRRYREKVADSLRRRLGDVIAHESVLSAPDGTVIRIRIPEKHEPRFRFRDGEPAQPAAGAGGADGGSGQALGGVGAGEGGDIARIPSGGPAEAGGGHAGTGHLEPGIVVELPVADLGEMLFTALGLPRLRPQAGEDPEAEDRLQGRGRTGVVLDKKRSVLAHMRRELSAGRPEPWSREDLTWRRWQTADRPTQRAAVVLVRDASGSIDDRMRYTIRAACFWIVRWLRHNYRSVTLHFVVHDTQARELDEHDFLHVGAMGGTFVSSGLALAQTILDREHPAGSWNRYAVFFSDGDDWQDDGTTLQRALSRLAESTALVAYGELRAPGTVRSVVAEAVERVRESRPHVLAAPLPGPDHVAGWLGRIFGEEAQTG